MKIYNVLCQDRHTDTTAEPFIDLERAIKHAKKIANNECRFPEDYKESNIDGWLFHARYSCEGDCVWITEHNIDGLEKV